MKNIYRIFTMLLLFSQDCLSSQACHDGDPHQTSGRKSSRASLESRASAQSDSVDSDLSDQDSSVSAKFPASKRSRSDQENSDPVEEEGEDSDSASAGAGFLDVGARMQAWMDKAREIKKPSPAKAVFIPPVDFSDLSGLFHQLGDRSSPLYRYVATGRAPKLSIRAVHAMAKPPFVPAVHPHLITKSSQSKYTEN